MSDKLLKLYIEPSSRCNLDCKMCFRNTWIDEDCSDMDMRVFMNTVGSMPDSVETVFFGGMGEPLINLDILAMVEFAANKGAGVSLQTNGTLLTRGMSAALLDRGLDMLWVSVDSFDEDEYETIRKNSSLELISLNIEDFNAERIRRQNTAKKHGNRGSAELGLAFVAMKSNISQLGALRRFADEHGVSAINISNVFPTDSFSVSENLFSRTLALDLPAKGLWDRRITLTAMDIHLECVRDSIPALLGTGFDDGVAGSKMEARLQQYCRFVNDGKAFVRHDGEVSPCMALLHSGVTYLGDKRRTVHSHSFGNAGKQSLSDIWGSEEYTAFRKRVMEFDFSPCVQCGGCDNRDENQDDCYGNTKPTCGACLWSEGLLSCP